MDCESFCDSCMYISEILCLAKKGGFEGVLQIVNLFSEAVRVRVRSKITMKNTSANSYEKQNIAKVAFAVPFAVAICYCSVNLSIHVWWREVGLSVHHPFCFLRFEIHTDLMSTR